MLDLCLYAKNHGSDLSCAISCACLQGQKGISVEADGHEKKKTLRGVAGWLLGFDDRQSAQMMQPVTANCVL